MTTTTVSDVRYFEKSYLIQIKKITVVGPISLLTKLQLNPKPEEDEFPYTIPKIRLGIKMEKLRLGISREQYKYVTQLIEVMGRMIRGTPYRKFRPVGIRKL